MSNNSYTPTELSEADIEALKGKLKQYPYLAYAGGSSLNPLGGAPQIAGAVETHDVPLYETNGQSTGAIIVKNEVTVTITTRNVDLALALKHDFKVGDDVFASSRSVELVLVPIDGNASQPIITFPNAYLQPGLGLTPGENAEPATAELVYQCRPDATTKKPYSYAPVTSGGAAVVISGGAV